jgi:hypothetical protein
MHQGAVPSPQSAHAPYVKQELAPGVTPPTASSAEIPTSSDIQDLISGASKQAEAQAPSNVAPAAATLTTAAAPPKEKAADEKKDKDKPKATRLVYQDTELSMEEKLASLSRFAFTPKQALIAA